MTISSESYKSGPYSGNDSTTVFSYGFKIYANTEIEVIKTATDGSETTLVLSTDYTVSGVGSDSGGDVTYPVTGSPLATGEKLTIRRVNPLTQLTDLRNQGAFFSENIEKAMDRLIMVVQQQQEKIDRMLRLPSSTTSSDLVIPDPESGKYLQWRADLTGLQNVEAFVAGAITVSSFGETLIDDPDASTALTTLGFGTAAQAFINDMDDGGSEWPFEYTPTFVSATSFTVATDVTAEFHANRRLKTQNTGGIVYSTIESSSYSAPNTTINVINDSGTLDSGISSAKLSILRADNESIPPDYKSVLQELTGTASFAVSAAWTTYGRTGSTAAVIWNELDNVPETAKWIEVSLYHEATNTGVIVTHTLYSRKGGSSLAVGAISKTSTVYSQVSSSTNTIAANSKLIKIPVNALDDDNLFELYCAGTFSGAVLTAVLSGWGY